MEIIFIILLFHFIFPLFKNRWVINVINGTSCLLLKQQTNGIIIIIVVCICELIQKSYTSINLLCGICSLINCSAAYHYRITIKHINSMYAFFTSRGVFFSARESCSGITKPSYR